MEAHVPRAVLVVALAMVMTLAAVPGPASVAEARTPWSPQYVDDTPLARAVSAGADHACFLLKSGAVRCQGARDQGQSRADSRGDVIQVSAGNGHTCLLRSDRAVACYGANTFGEALTDGKRDAMKVSAGGDHTCILRRSGDVNCHGRNDDGQAATFLGSVVDVSAGGRHTCVVRSTGNVECAGWNFYGQANPYSGGDAVAVSAGAAHTCILLSRGDVECRGRTEYGQAQDYHGGDAVGVSAGEDHTCVLRASGSVVCYGSNRHGQSEPYSGRDAVQVAAGDRYTCILLRSGLAHCQGMNGKGQATSYPFPSDRVQEGWARTYVLSHSVSMLGIREPTPGVSYPVAAVKGEGRGSYFHVVLFVNDQPVAPVSVYSAGLMQGSMEVNVVDVPPSVLEVDGVTVTTVVYADWQPSKTFCVLGMGNGCLVGLPFFPADVGWAMGPGDDATLTVGVRVQTTRGEILYAGTVDVPLAGQAVGSQIPFRIDDASALKIPLP